MVKNWGMEGGRGGCRLPHEYPHLPADSLEWLSAPPLQSPGDAWHVSHLHILLCWLWSPLHSETHLVACFLLARDPLPFPLLSHPVKLGRRGACWLGDLVDIGTQP